MAKKQTTSLVKSTQPLTIEPAPVYISKFNPQITGDLLSISKSALKQGVHLEGGSGAGKSRLLGRGFAFTALVREEPAVILDPNGAVVDNLFDKIIRLPLDVQQKLWPRILYVNAGAQDYVVPAPLYYRQSPSDTLFEIANRFPAVIKRQDENLVSAPILGWNSLYECAINGGQIAAALGRQIDFVADLINQPGKYKTELRQVLAEHPELHRQVSYFRELMDPTSSGLRERRTGSFKNKLIPFLSDPTMLATFAAPNWKLDFAKLIEKRKIVLIDLRNEWDPDRRQFKMIWYFLGFTNYIKHRGMAGRGYEVLFIIDEITAMLGQRTQEGNSILAEDLEELTAVLGRNYAVNVILSHQNLSQVSERIQNVLMQMGNQIIGVTPNPDDALRIARQFVSYDAYLVKKTENVWMSVTEPPLIQYFSGHWGPVPTVIDHRTVEMTHDEQLILFADKLRNLGRFRFYAKIAVSEGDIRGDVKRISIARLDQNQHPNEQVLAPLRDQLTRRDGISVDELLAKMQLPGKETQKLHTPSPKSAKLNVNPPYVTAAPVTPDTNTPLQSGSEPVGAANEDPWQE